MKSHTRVVVIGGGIVGCSVLYHLTRLGWHDVVLVERDELTCGSTWHAAGLNHLYASSYLMTRIAKESLDLYRALETDGGQPGGVHITGGVRLSRAADGVDEFRRYLEPARSLGIDAEIIGPNRVHELFPLLESDKFIAALHTPGEGYVDATITTNALAGAARQAGAQIYRHCPVTGLRRTPAGAWNTETPNGIIASEVVINCAGCWGGEVSKLLGEYLPVLTQEHQYLVTEHTDVTADLVCELPVLRDPSVPFYCRQERQALMVSGFEHEVKFAWLDGAPSHFSMELYPPDLDRALPCLQESFEMVPALKDLGIKTIVNGPIPATPDMQGLLGPAHGLHGYFACCGIHGGFVQGGLTRYLAEWVVDGEPSIDLRAVDVRRFGPHMDQEACVSRISAAHTMFSLPAIYPAMEPEGGRQLRKGPLFDILSAKGAVFGWEVANWFAPIDAEPADRWSFERTNWFEPVGRECRQVREQAGLLDLTCLATFSVEGSGSEAFLNELSASRLPGVGERRVCPFLTTSGGIEAVVHLDCRADEAFVLTAPAGTEYRLSDWLDRYRVGHEVVVQNRTDKTGSLLLAGPNVIEVLTSATGEELQTVAVGDCVDTELGTQPVHLVRVDDVDVNTWEIHHAIANQTAVYEALMVAGKDRGLEDFGMRAYESLRLERGLPRWGYDFSLEMTPQASGLGALVDPSKGRFIGQEALANESSTRGRYQLVLLNVDDTQLAIDPWGGENVELDGEVVGMVTSGARGHSTNTSLAFAQILPAHAVEGTRLQVVMLGERYNAVTGPAPSPAMYPALSANIAETLTSLGIRVGRWRFTRWQQREK